MATYDNKIWLLKNIRDAFIATDDTGLCESVMGSENFSRIFYSKAMKEKKRLREEKLSQPGMSRGKESGAGDACEVIYEREIVTRFDPYPDMEDSDDDLYGSYMRYEDYAGHRHRQNTAQLLQKKEQALKKAAKIKVIKWENASNDLTEEQIAEIFSKAEIKKPEKKMSLFADQLENCPELLFLQYQDYSKYDGGAQTELPTKLFKIFMTIVPENYQLNICIIANAKIKDLIGFICFKYSLEHNVDLGPEQNYGLCIAEDDGEVDFAFPCLDVNEPCSKFGFPCLGLVELKRRDQINQTTISLPVDGSLVGSLLYPKSTDSGHSQQPSASRHNTGGSNTSRELKRAMEVLNEDRHGGGDMGSDNKPSHIAEAPQYKTYRVQLMRKVRTNTPVQLTITLDRIEVEPIVMHKHAFWARSKYIRHSIDLVAWCQILEAKSSRTSFRVVYSPSHNTSISDRSAAGSSSFFHPNSLYKHHDFECEHETAREIVDKVNTILELRNSPCRREYKTAKEKKLQSRRSFHTRHMS